MLSLLFILKANAVHQSCKFSFYNQINDSYAGPQQSYYECMITRAELLNETEPVITHTSTNNQTNQRVDAITYSGGNVKFVPNSVFEVFPNILIFSMFATKLEVLRPEFWKNAKKLKVIYIPQSNLKRLDANLFVEAENLEHINLNFNAIETVDKSTFNGLKNLKGIYLQGNKISLLYPETFSKISSLKVLDLNKNFCIDRKFFHVQLQTHQVEAEIRKFCAYDHSEEFLEVERKKSEEEMKLSKKFEDLAEVVKNDLRMEHQKLIANLRDIKESSCNLAAKIESLQEQIIQVTKVGNLSNSTQPSSIEIL